MTALLRPEDLLDRAADSPEGVQILFVNARACNGFRVRLWKAQRRAEASAPNEPHPWSDLVLRQKGNELLVGKPTRKTFGIVRVREIKKDDEEARK